MRNTFIILILFLFSYSFVSAQDDSYSIKVKKMLKLSGSSDNFNAAVSKMMDLERETYQSILPIEFFEELETEMLDIGFEKLVPKFIPIYRKHLTEEDLDGIIAFYESAPGKKLAEKTPLILVDAMQIGAEWGAEIGEMIFHKVQGSNEFLFTNELEQDCSHLKEGTFELTFDGLDKTFMIERKDGFQTETYGDDSIKYTIEWSSNNKYIVKEIQFEDRESEFVEVNIYEVEGDTAKFIAKESDTYLKGEIKKIE